MNALKIGLLALTLSTSLNTAFAGSESGGGGNPIAARPNTEIYIPEAQRIISEIRPIARLELNDLKNWYSCYGNNCDADPLLVAKARFLKDPTKSRKLIDSVKIEVRENQPCETTINGVSKHEAASATLPDKVCFSLSEIAKFEISQENPGFLARMIKSLFMHELTHLLGGDEVEAKAFQEGVQYRSESAGGADSIYAVHMIPQALEDFAEISKELAATIVSVNKKDRDAAVCSKAQRVMTTFMRTMYLSLTEKDAWAYDRTLTRLNAITVGFCEQDPIYVKFFNGKKTMTELEFQLKNIREDKESDPESLSRASQEAIKLSSTSVYYRNLMVGGRATLEAELLDIQKELNSVIDNVRLMQAL